MTELEYFIAKRNAALVAIDIDAAKELGISGSDHVIVMALHKERYECTDIAPELRHESGRWLRDNQCSRLNGFELLPEGELP